MYYCCLLMNGWMNGMGSLRFEIVRGERERERIYQVTWTMELKTREKASLMRKKERKEKREESCRKVWRVWTKMLKQRMGGMYRVRGTAENATANNSSSIFLFFLSFLLLCEREQLLWMSKRWYLYSTQNITSFIFFLSRFSNSFKPFQKII